MIFVFDFFVISREVYEKKSLICPSVKTVCLVGLECLVNVLLSMKEDFANFERVLFHWQTLVANLKRAVSRFLSEWEDIFVPLISCPLCTTVSQERQKSVVENESGHHLSKFLASSTET